MFSPDEEHGRFLVEYWHAKSWRTMYHTFHCHKQILMIDSILQGWSKFDCRKTPKSCRLSPGLGAACIRASNFGCIAMSLLSRKN